MIFKRKIYNRLLEWKTQYADKYSVLLEGSRRVGKSTIALNFAKSEYGKYIFVDFANVSSSILDCFKDINNPEVFFLRLQAATGVNLIAGNSLIIFDEIQLFPKARQAIKYLVKYGKYHYMETGSLISIKQNVSDILIPSEEMKISVYPLDYEEFLWNTKLLDYSILKDIYKKGNPIGQSINRKLMRDLRIYMAVGGMPQSVEAYIEGKSFAEIDIVKREIISLYLDDFMKIDKFGRLSNMYKSIPSQISSDKIKYSYAKATNKRKPNNIHDLIYNLADSKTVLPAYNATDPRVSMSLSKDLRKYKLYLADIGLFVTLMFFDRPEASNDIYSKLMLNKLPANLGFLYENLVAQMIASTNTDLFYHTWKKYNSTHYYEIDFLIANRAKIDAIEVKSSGVGKHESLNVFYHKYSQNAKNLYVLSQKDLDTGDKIKYYPFYLAPIIFEDNQFN